MKNFKTFALAIALMTTFTISAFAGNDNVNKEAVGKSHLQTQVVKLIQETNKDMTSLDGQALVTFSVDADRNIHVKGVFGTNEVLIDHVTAQLEGASVQARDSQIGKEYKLKVNFQDLR